MWSINGFHVLEKKQNKTNQLLFPHNPFFLQPFQVDGSKDKIAKWHKYVFMNFHRIYTKRAAVFRHSLGLVVFALYVNVKRTCKCTQYRQIFRMQYQSWMNIVLLTKNKQKVPWLAL